MIKVKCKEVYFSGYRNYGSRLEAEANNFLNQFKNMNYTVLSVSTGFTPNNDFIITVVYNDGKD